MYLLGTQQLLTGSGFIWPESLPDCLTISIHAETLQTCCKSYTWHCTCCCGTLDCIWNNIWYSTHSCEDCSGLQTSCAYILGECSALWGEHEANRLTLYSRQLYSHSAWCTKLLKVHVVYISDTELNNPAQYWRNGKDQEFTTGSVADIWRPVSRQNAMGNKHGVQPPGKIIFKV